MINLLWIFAFTFFFALFDYFGYNEFAKRGLANGLLAPYRIVQMSVQIILIAVAWAFVDLMVAIGFTILWATWTCDFIYYFLYDTLKIYGSGAFKKEVMGGQVSWAWWTPYGLIDWLINGKNGDEFRVIHWSILAIQSLIGIILTVIITFLT